MLIPKRYTVIKDDTPWFHLNSEMQPGTEDPKTLPKGFDYEVALSLHAETCLSEFRQVEKAPPGTGQKRDGVRSV